MKRSLFAHRFNCKGKSSDSCNRGSLLAVIGILVTSCSLVIIAPRRAFSLRKGEKKGLPSSRKTIQSNLLSVSVHGLLQSWLTTSFDKNEPYTHLGERYLSFRIRRARLIAKAKFSQFASASFMIDAARVMESLPKEFPVVDQNGKKLGTVKVNPAEKNSFLLDSYFTIHISKYFNFSFGQANIPVSLEGYGSSGKLFFAERADVSRKFGAQWDLGLWFSGELSFLHYLIGVYNGSGFNSLDKDPLKDLALRLTARPFKMLLIGLSFYRTLGELSKGGKMLAGGDLELQFEPFLLRGELYWRERGISEKEVVDELGAYILAAYQFALGRFSLEPALRWEWFDSALTKEGGETWRLTGGLNLYLLGHKLKLQLNYIHTQSWISSGKTSPPSQTNDMLILVGQAAF